MGLPRCRLRRPPPPLPRTPRRFPLLLLRRLRHVWFGGSTVPIATSATGTTTLCHGSDHVLRSVTGGCQGCGGATLLCVLTYHLSLCALQRLRPRHARFASNFLPCWSQCRRVNPSLAALPIHPDPAVSSPTIAAFHTAYDNITTTASTLRRRYAELDRQTIHWVDGSSHHPYHPRTALARPNSLPPTASEAFDDAACTPASRYSQRALAAVVNDTAWLQLHLSATTFDATNAAAVVPHRETTRLISCSQEGSGAFIARLPDTTLTGSIIASSAFLVILQRRLGLFLTALTSGLNAAAAAGQPVTEYHRLGDADINDANNTARHNSTLYATYHAIKAVIPPAAPPAPVVLCDRGDGSPASKETARQRWAHVNAGHVPDIARLGTPPHAYELKVYTPYNQTVALGLGSTRNGGAPSTAEGHTHAFGCTEENLRKLVLGLKQVGSRSGAPYDRVTGAGFVAAHNGQYADALSKGVGVSLLVAETTGALKVRSQPHS
jgi:hypothetical protein